MRDSSEIDQNSGEMFTPPKDERSRIQWLRELRRIGAMIPRVQEGPVSVSDFLISADFGTEEERTRAINKVREIDISNLREDERIRAGSAIMKKGVHEGPIYDIERRYMINGSVNISDSCTDSARIIDKEGKKDVLTTNRSHNEIIHMLSPYMSKSPFSESEVAYVDIESEGIPVECKLNDTGSSIRIYYERRAVLAELMLRGMIDADDLPESMLELPLTVEYQLAYLGKKEDNPSFDMSFIVPLEVHEALTRQCPDVLTKLESFVRKKTFLGVPRFGPDYEFTLTQTTPVIEDLHFVARCSEEVLRKSQDLVLSYDDERIRKEIRNSHVKTQDNHSSRFRFQTWFGRLKLFTEEDTYNEFNVTRSKLADLVTRDFETAAGELLATIFRIGEIGESTHFDCGDESFICRLFTEEYLDEVINYIDWRLSVDPWLSSSNNVQALLRRLANFGNIGEKARAKLLDLL